MKALLIITIMFFAFSVNAQYVQPIRHISTEDLNLRAQQLTQQCVYLHLAAVGSDVLGVVLIGVASANGVNGGSGRRRMANPNTGLAVAGVVCILGGGVCEILEWIKVSHAHSILSLGDPRLSFNSGKYGLGVTYNF
jgi:hypothetical protein